jgi:hypothetical protein
MRINNIGEFKTFLVDNQLDNLDSTVVEFVACVLQYNLFCSCKKAQKSQKHEICNQQYMHAVSTTLTTKKDIIFSKIQDNTIEFYYNQNYHIATISRQ